MTDKEANLRRKIRIVLLLFILGLIVSGVTAFPLRWEVDLLARWLGASETACPEVYAGLTRWIVTVRNGLRETDAKYPFLAYGTDWLAFGHIVIALFFFAPLSDPVRNRSVLVSGVAACGLVPVLALICGPLRGIPFYWRLIDCSFGIVGCIPLLLCLHWVREIEASASAHPQSALTAQTALP